MERQQAEHSALTFRATRDSVLAPLSVSPASLLAKLPVSLDTVLDIAAVGANVCRLECILSILVSPLRH